MDARSPGLDLVHARRLCAVLGIPCGVLDGGVPVLPYAGPIRRDEELVYPPLTVCDTTPHRVGRQKSKLGYLRADAVPNDLNVTLPVELEVETQLPQEVLVGLLQHPLGLEPLLRLLFPVGSVEALAVYHLAHAIDHSGLDGRPKEQVPQVIAVEVIVSVGHKLPPRLLPEKGQLVGG